MALFGLTVVLLVVLVVVAAVAVIIVGSRRREVRSAAAQVLGVRELTAGGATQYWVNLRFADGHQRELLATESQAEVLFRGQSGTVHWVGDRLTGFVPQLSGGPQDKHRSD